MIYRIIRTKVRIRDTQPCNHSLQTASMRSLRMNLMNGTCFLRTLFKSTHGTLMRNFLLTLLTFAITIISSLRVLTKNCHSNKFDCLKLQIQSDKRIGISHWILFQSTGSSTSRSLPFIGSSSSHLPWTCQNQG